MPAKYWIAVGACVVLCFMVGAIAFYGRQGK